MRTSRNQLCEALEQASELLHEDVPFWAEALNRLRMRILQGDMGAIDDLRRSFGGMGSLNDIVFTTYRGNEWGTQTVEDANQTLDRLRSDIYKLTATVREE